MPPQDARRPALDQLVAFLSNPDSYPERVERVERAETHASLVFLAGDDVYKLKKPVDFGFLDYSTLEQRERMCRLEVELNRRLAPDVYLGVVALTRGDDDFQLDGPGDVIDYLVHMRHLPESATLSAHVAQGAVSPEAIDAVARRIGAFHREAPRSPAIDRWGHPEAIRHNVEENFEQTRAFIDRTLPVRVAAEIERYARGFLADNEALLRRRVEAGMTRDGHGDLRAEHVYLLDDVTIVDCIEFNDRLRCGDVAADVGFLAMDLDAMNRPDLSDRLIATYSASSGFDVAPVLDFYRCYRAYVRGKVASFRLDGAGVRREARRFFHLAHRYAAGRRGPRLIVMSGLTGSGKSTLARELAEILPADVNDSDSTRKRLAGLASSDRQEVGVGEGIYSSEMSGRVYQALLDGARDRLRRGQTVILDATYIRREDRAAAAKIAAAAGARFLVAHCAAPEEITRQRLAERGKDPTRSSDGRWEIYLAQRDEADSFTDAEADNLVTVDTVQNLDAQAEQVLTAFES